MFYLFISKSQYQILNKINARLLHYVNSLVLYLRAVVEYLWYITGSKIVYNLYRNHAIGSKFLESASSLVQVCYLSLDKLVGCYSQYRVCYDIVLSYKINRFVNYKIGSMGSLINKNYG